MSHRLNLLYPEMIRKHSETPFHFIKVDAAHSVPAYNPVCGDKFTVFIDINDQVLSAVHFHGFGCAISKASTSLLAKVVEGKTIDSALSISRQFQEFLDGGTDDGSSTLAGELKTFSGVWQFPERAECATLSWKALSRFLESLNGQHEN